MGSQKSYTRDEAIDSFGRTLFDGYVAKCICNDGVWLYGKVVKPTCGDSALFSILDQRKAQNHFVTIVDHIPILIILQWREIDFCDGDIYLALGLVLFYQRSAEAIQDRFVDRIAYQYGIFRISQIDGDMGIDLFSQNIVGIALERFIPTSNHKQKHSENAQNFSQFIPSPRY